MNNSKFLHFLRTGNITDPEWERYWQEIEPQQQQAGTFAGLFASTHAAQQAQMSLPAATRQMPEQRQLDELNVVQHPAAQYSPPFSQHAFQLLETYQPLFLEQSSFDHSNIYDQSSAIVQFGPPLIYSNPFDPLEEIEQVMKDSNEEHAPPVQPGQNTPPLRKITHSVSEDEIDTSVDKHSKRTLSKAVMESSKSLRISAKISARTSTSTNTGAIAPTSEQRTTIETSIQPENGPRIVPPAVPFTVVAANIAQAQSDNPALMQKALLASADPLAWAEEFVRYTDSRTEPFKCGFEGCGKTSAIKQRLKRHMFTHRRFSTLECPHPSCANNDKDRYHRDSFELARHIRTKHTRERPYPCYFCTQTFLRSDHARVHMRSLHPQQFDRRLIECLRTITSTNTRSSARRSNSTSTSTSTSTDAIAPTSKQGTTSETSIQPESGPEIIPSALPLTVAANIAQPQSDNPALVQEAPLACADPLAWAEEFVIYTENRSKPFKCGFEGCGKTSTRKQFLKKHMFSHRRFSTFECLHPSCVNNDKLRYHRDSFCLNRHIRTRHTRERPYPCYFCTQTFLRSDHARVHMKTLHREQFDKWLNEQGRSRGK